jgi:hypothetical protein
MTARDFIAGLRSEIETRTSQLKQMDDEVVAGPIDVVRLLKIALRNEAEAFEVAARWVADTTVWPVKIAFARQCGDEAKHYEWIAGRLRQLGATLDGFDPLADGFSPVTQLLLGLATPAERLAAGFMAREAVACIKNNQFIGAVEAIGDLATARLYREQIQPDERHHCDLGAELLAPLVEDEEAQLRALRCARQVLDRVSSMQQTAASRLGVKHAPGC